MFRDHGGVANFWAPEVYERGGKFYMLYSADWKENPTNELENFRIGVAVADKPTGPFKELFDKPLFDPGYPVIDGNLIDDEDGRTYLYFSRCCYKHPVESEIAEKAKKRREVRRDRGKLDIWHRGKAGFDRSDR